MSTKILATINISKLTKNQQAKKIQQIANSWDMTPRQTLDEIRALIKDTRNKKEIESLRDAYYNAHKMYRALLATR